MTRWIPKSLLQAQRYSGGEGKVWLPRQPQHQKPAFPSPSEPRQRRAIRAQHRRRTHRRWVPVPLLDGQGFYQGNDQIWVPKLKKTAATNGIHQDKTQSKAPKSKKMVWVQKDRMVTDRPRPPPPTRVLQTRAEPQEPTWRRVAPNATPQKVEP